MRLARLSALLLLACTTTATPGGPRPCTASDLAGAARWQGATGGLAGALTLDVPGPSACALPGQLQIDVVDDSGQSLASAQVTGPSPAPVDIQPGQSRSLRFVWRNWCGAQPAAPLALSVWLPTDQDALTVPVADSAGDPSTDTPRCDAPAEPSTLTVIAWD